MINQWSYHQPMANTLIMASDYYNDDDHYGQWSWWAIIMTMKIITAIHMDNWSLRTIWCHGHWYDDHRCKWQSLINQCPYHQSMTTSLSWPMIIIIMMMIAMAINIDNWSSSTIWWYGAIDMKMIIMIAISNSWYLNNGQYHYHGQRSF